MHTYLIKIGPKNCFLRRECLKAERLFKKSVRKVFVFFLMITAVSFMVPGKSRAYVMPAEQLIGFMAMKFAKIRTLVISQSTHLINKEGQAPEKVIKETLWMKAPGIFYSQIERETVAEGANGLGNTEFRVSPDMAFRRLFMGQSSTGLMMLLSTMGINLETVSYTRLNGVIAYQIGDDDAGTPQLLVEKERFLPLLIRYRVSVDSARKMVTVRFDEYRKLANGWYPYQITYAVGENILERYLVDDLQVNVPVAPSFFEDRGPGARPVKDFEYSEGEADESRLRGIIRLLEEKYR